MSISRSPPELRPAAFDPKADVGLKRADIKPRRIGLRLLRALGVGEVLRVGVGWVYSYLSIR